MGKKQTRRTFLKTAAFTTAGLGMMTAKSYSSIIGANDRIRFAGAKKFCRQIDPERHL